MGWLTLSNLYLVLFFFGLGVAAVLLVLGLGGDLSEGAGSDADVEAGGLGKLGLFFSPSLLAIFFGVFGGVGYLCTQVPPLKSPIINVPIALFTALFALFGLFLRFQRWMRGMEATSHAPLEELVGDIAESLSPIPPKGLGSVAYTYAGSRRTAPARNRTDTLIPKGNPVRIVSVVGDILIVEGIEEPLKVREGA